MGKRSNDLGQIKREDYESQMAEISSAPKGPFEKAPGEVLSRRRIVRAVRNTASPDPGVTKSSKSSNPFSGFSFGTKKSVASPGPPSQYPSFAMPSTAAAMATSQHLSSMPAISKTKKMKENNDDVIITAADHEKIDCVESFRKHMLASGPILDLSAMDHFLIRYRTLINKEQKTKKVSTKNDDDNKTTSSSNSKTETSYWDSNKPLFPTDPVKLGSVKTSKNPTAPPLFGGKSVVPSPSTAVAIETGTPMFSFSNKKSLSPATAGGGGFSFSANTAASQAPTPTKGFSFSTTKSPAPAPAGGGFSFSLPTTSSSMKSPAPALAFSFSSTQAPDVKAAAVAAAAASTSASTDNPDDSNTNDNEETTAVLESADDDHDVLYTCPTKVLQVSTNSYLAKGNLKLEKHKESKKCSVVVRDKVVGTVKFNASINHRMPLEKIILPANPGKKNSKPTYIIAITTINEGGDNPEIFKIVTTVDDHEKLYNELKTIVE